MKIILDTNVLISGIFFSGPPNQILKAWREGEIQFALSPEIIDEYLRVSRILADSYPGVEITEILTTIVTRSETVQAQKLAHQVCEDPDDDKFLACAMSSETQMIVTGDKSLLMLSGFRGITILTPRRFAEQYLKKHL